MPHPGRQVVGWVNSQPNRIMSNPNTPAIVAALMVPMQAIALAAIAREDKRPEVIPSSVTAFTEGYLTQVTELVAELEAPESVIQAALAGSKTPEVSTKVSRSL